MCARAMIFVAMRFMIGIASFSIFPMESTSTIILPYGNICVHSAQGWKRVQLTNRGMNYSSRKKRTFPSSSQKRLHILI